MKTCARCGLSKPVTAFARDARSRDGLSVWCRDCRVEAGRLWRFRHQDQSLAERRSRYRPRTWPKSVRCHDCGAAFMAHGPTRVRCDDCRAEHKKRLERAKWRRRVRVRVCPCCGGRMSHTSQLCRACIGRRAESRNRLRSFEAMTRRAWLEALQ